MKGKNLKFGNKAPANITPQDCLPCDLQQSLHMKTWDDLVSLGVENLQDCIRYWRSEVRVVDKRISRERNTRDFLTSHRTFESVCAYAAEYYGLKDGYGSRYSEQTMTPVPTDADDLERAASSSTLNVCGWCKFCRAGWQHSRSSCKLSGSCDLIPDDHVLGATPIDPRRFNHECAFLRALKQQPWLLSSSLAESNRRLSALNRERFGLSERIRQLKLAQKLSVSKPAFPQCRRDVYCEGGDRVRMMLPRREDLYASNGLTLAPIRTGTVILDFRTDDSIQRALSGCTSARDAQALIATDIMMSSGYVKVKLDTLSERLVLWDTCVTHPFILSEDDFRKLRKDKDYRTLWLEAIYDPRTPWVHDSWQLLLGEYDNII